MNKPGKPEKFDVGGITVEGHRPWCPIEKLRQRIARNDHDPVVFSDKRPAPICRCHLKPVKETK